MHKLTFKEQKASKCHAYRSNQNIILKQTEVKKVKLVDF